MAKTKNTKNTSKEVLNNLKMEVASELGVNIKNGCNGDLTAKEAGKVGGEMVKRMVNKYENQ